MKITRYKNAIMLAFRLAVFGVLAISIAAQSEEGVDFEPPLPHESVDDYGVDLLSGSPKIKGANLTIGIPQSGLQYIVQDVFSGRHSFSGKLYMENTLDPGLPEPPKDINPDGYYVSVYSPSGSAKFTQDNTAYSGLQGTFTLYEGRGQFSILSSNRFRYMDESGVEYYYKATPNADTQWKPGWKPRTLAELYKIIKPDGEVIEIFEIAREGPQTQYKVISSLGWALVKDSSYERTSSSSESRSSYSYDLRAVNTSKDHCGANQAICEGFSQSWPVVRLSSTGSKINSSSTNYSSSRTISMINANGRVSYVTSYYDFPVASYDTYHITYAGGVRVYTKQLCTSNELAQGALKCRNSSSFNSGRVVKAKLGNEEFSYGVTKYSGGSYSNGTEPTILTASGPEGAFVFRSLAAGYPIKWIDNRDRETVYYWTGGQIHQERFNDGLIDEYLYDYKGNLQFKNEIPKNGAAPLVTEAVYPTCENTTTTKNCNKPTSITTADGVTTAYTWDPVHGGLLTKTSEAVNGVQAQTRYRYEQKRAKIKNSAGSMVQSDPVWRLVEISSCRTMTLDSCVGTDDEKLVTIDYDVDGVVPNQKTWNALPVRKTVALGDGSISLTTKTEYDVLGNVTSIDGPKPGEHDKTYFYYDSMRRKVAEIGVDPDGPGPHPRTAKRFFYNEDGNLRTVDTGLVSSTTLSAVNNMTEDLRVNTSYDANIGKPTAVTTFAKGVLKNITQKSYDDMLRLECEAQRLNPSEFHSLPASACELGDAGTEGADRITKYTYDLTGELEAVYQAVGTQLQRAYKTNKYRDDNGLLEFVKDAAGNTTFYDYDEYNRLEKTVYPNKTNGGQRSSTDYEQTFFDGARVSKVRLRDGKEVHFSDYDERGRVTSKTGDVREEFEYDNFSNVVKHTNTTSGYYYKVKTSGFDFNALGWKKSETTGTDQVAYQYNDYGQRIRLTWPDNFYVTYDYKVSGYPSDQLQSIKEYDSTVIASFGYDAHGRRDLLVRGNGVVTDYEYDDLSRLDLLSTEVSGGYSLYETLKYTVSGQLKSKTLDASSGLYRYQAEPGKTISYGEPNALNQIESVNTSGTDYDDRGNMTSVLGASYSYNANNLLLNVSSPNHSLSLRYDSENRLSRLTVNGSITDFRYDGEDLIMEKNSSGATTARYVHGPGVDDPIVWYEGSGTGNKRYFTENAQGSIVNITTKYGSKYAVNSYDEYGIPASTNVGRFQYTGQVYLGGGSGLYYYKARVYHPALGRFLQTDPVGYEDQMNLYAYVHNDPINMVDPTGEFGIVGALIGAGVEAAIQLGTTGKISDWKAVGVAGAVGAVTGGVGGRLATQALKGTISAAKAVRTTAAVGGAANGVGTVATNAMNGKATTATEAAIAVAGGAAGAGAGAKIANKVASKLDDLASSSSLGQHISDTTRASFGGGATVEAGASTGETVGAAAAEAAANLTQKELNERF